MQIEITPAEEQSPELKYPVLMATKDPSSTMVVLFISQFQGLAIKHPMGSHFDTEWTSATNAEVWKPFTGKITLSN